MVKGNGIFVHIKNSIMPYSKVYESFNVAEFQLVKHALASAKIDFVVWNEAVLQTGAGFGGMHGARLLVHKEELDKATEVLEKFDFLDEEE